MKVINKRINFYTVIPISILILIIFGILIFHGRQTITNYSNRENGKAELFVREVQRPQGLALGKNEEIFTQTSYDGKIFMINKDGKLFDYAYLDGYQSYGIKIDKNDNFILARGKEVVKADSSGKVIQSFVGFNYAYDVEIAPNGTIFVSDSMDNIIYKISPQGYISEFLKLEGRRSSDMQNVAGIRLDKQSKNLYAVNMYSGNLLRIELTEDYQPEKVVIAASGLKKPNFLDLDIEGNVYITCLEDNSIVRVDQNCIVETIDTGGKLSAPNGIIYVVGQNNSGILYVASHDSNSIYKINIGIKNKTKK